MIGKSEEAVSMIQINIKHVKRCATCKYWYDPTNSAVEPRAPRLNLWRIDDKCKKMCLRRNYEMSGGAYCNEHECKLEIQ